jgi:AP-1 complex subunit sigma 1/2
VRDFDTVTSALNFDTPDCHVTGGCDLYTTRAAGSDKKLYKDIDKSLESQHAALLKLGQSLSPPQQKQLEKSHALSRSSPFGNLAEISSRRTFAYLIATLNASHPDYDFSHVLRPADFKRERNLPKVMSALDSTLSNVRPVLPGVAAASPLWGPHMWAMIDKEMTLHDATVFSYQPADDPFDEEDGAIWAHHYFFFNKSRKRVAYLHVRGVPVVSHGSPRGATAPMSMLSSSPAKRRRALTTSSSMLEDMRGANKRARFWLGDTLADRIVDDDSDGEFDDGMMWNRGLDGEIGEYYDDDDAEPGLDEDVDDEDLDSEEEPDEDDDDDEVATSPMRGVSEDIAGRMEI